MPNMRFLDRYTLKSYEDAVEERVKMSKDLMKASRNVSFPGLPKVELYTTCQGSPPATSLRFQAFTSLQQDTLWVLSQSNHI